ncbi:MAG: hypothetical protein H7X75_03270, partial [Burkholderiaceae bacterium]|nr:hypothetical protein [Burkholderiaceae bacterium]
RYGLRRSDQINAAMLVTKAAMPDNADTNEISIATSTTRPHCSCFVLYRTVLLKHRKLQSALKRLSEAHSHRFLQVSDFSKLGQNVGMVLD